MLLGVACDPRPCRPASLTGDAGQGQVELPSAATSPVRATTTVSPAPSGTCRLSNFAVSGRDADDSISSSFTLECLRPPNSEGVDFSVEANLADVRKLAAGSHEITTGSQDLKVWFPAAGGATCYGFLQGLKYTVTVDEAAGGAQPYPTVVTADFKRKVSFHIPIDRQDDKGQSWDGELHDCTFSPKAIVDLSFEVAASNLTVQPTSSCRYE
jgi:hypothetical protein